MRGRIAAVLCLLLVAPVHAQAQRKSAFQGDPRLDKPVTVRWKKATLFEALQELSRATGVRLTPERAIVDEPVMASATNVPAREILDQIATITRYTWARNGGTAQAPIYLFYQDRVAKEEEQAAIDGARRQVLEALQQELTRYRQVARMNGNQLEEQVQKADQQFAGIFSNLANINNNPRVMRQMMDSFAVRAVASPTGRAMLDLLDSLNQQEWNVLLDGEQLSFSSRPSAGEMPLPPAFHDRLRSASPGFPFPKAMFQSFGDQVVQGITMAEKMMQDNWQKSDGFRVTVSLTLDSGSQPVGMLRANPEPLGTPEGLNQLFALSGLNIVGAPTYLTEPDEDPEVREKRLGSHPLLGKKAVVKLTEKPAQPAMPFIPGMGAGHPVAEVLPLVETAWGVKLVSDAYNRQAANMVQNPDAAGVPLFKMLDSIAGAGRRWELDGNVIRFKSKTWAHDRRAEIPMRYMQRWLDEREKKGGFTLDDLAEIASILRDEQVDSLMFAAMELGNQDLMDFVMLPANRNILRFYAKLLPVQRRQLAQGKPLQARQLYPPQQAALLVLGRNKNPSMFAMAMGSKPPRTPDMLAGAVITLENQDIQQMAEQARKQAEEAARAAGAAQPGQPGQPQRGQPQQPAGPGTAPTVQPPPGAGAAPGAPQPAGGQVRVNVGPNGARATATIPGMGTLQAFSILRLEFPDGQKDEYRILLTRPAPKAEK